MSAVPHDPHRPPSYQPPAAPPPAAEGEHEPETSLSVEEEAFLCARYEEERRLLENAESSLGCDWPEGPLLAGGCGW